MYWNEVSPYWSKKYPLLRDPTVYADPTMRNMKMEPIIRDLSRSLSDLADMNLTAS